MGFKAAVIGVLLCSIRASAECAGQCPEGTETKGLRPLDILPWETCHGWTCSIEGQYCPEGEKAIANASAYRDVRAYALGDLRADEGDDGRALLRADHGHLRSIVDADGYGRAELYAVGHKRADQVGAFAPRFIYPCKQEQSSLQIRLR